MSAVGINFDNLFVYLYACLLLANSKIFHYFGRRLIITIIDFYSTGYKKKKKEIFKRALQIIIKSIISGYFTVGERVRFLFPICVKRTSASSEFVLHNERIKIVQANREITYLSYAYVASAELKDKDIFILF